MTSLSSRSALIVLSTLAAPFPILAQQPALPDVLKAAAEYVVKYAGQLSVIEAEEQSTQHDTSSGQIAGSRRLKSDFVVIGSDDGRVASFRDAFEVDGRSLRERSNRLIDLLRKPNPASLEEARALSEASVRQYISPNLHVLDDPMLPLEFLRQQNQERFGFTLDSVRTMDGSRVAILRFTEQGQERLIKSAENVPITGRMSIDAATGALRQAELSFSGKAFNLRSTIKFTADQTLGLWLPSEVVLSSDVRGTGYNNTVSNMGAGGQLAVRETLEARVIFSNYRQVTKPDR